MQLHCLAVAPERRLCMSMNLGLDAGDSMHHWKVRCTWLLSATFRYGTFFWGVACCGNKSNSQLAHQSWSANYHVGVALDDR